MAIKKDRQLPLIGFEALPDTFRERIEIQPDGCWRWTAGTKGKVTPAHPNGEYAAYYPRGHGVGVLAHRWVYELVIGKIPDGKTIDHLCENTLCVRPDHLEAVTLKQNMRRARDSRRKRRVSNV